MIMLDYLSKPRLVPMYMYMYCVHCDSWPGLVSIPEMACHSDIHVYSSICGICHFQSSFGDMLRYSRRTYYSITG